MYDKVPLPPQKCRRYFYQTCQVFFKLKNLSHIFDVNLSRFHVWFCNWILSHPPIIYCFVRTYLITNLIAPPSSWAHDHRDQTSPPYCVHCHPQTTHIWVKIISPPTHRSPHRFLFHRSTHCLCKLCTILSHLSASPSSYVISEFQLR